VNVIILMSGTGDISKKLIMNAIVRFSKINLKVLIFLLIVLLPNHSLLAQGWLTPWLYRSSVNVTNSVATGLTDYQVLISLNTGNFNFAMASTDGSDITVTGSDGTTLIPYWIEKWAQDTAANIWVKIPSIPASGSTTIYLYYGNSEISISSSNGTNTFVYFEDFESWNVIPHPSVWQDLSSTAPIPTPSADLTISVYNKKLYSFGGYGIGHEVLNTVYEYDPAGAWTRKADMPSNRWGMLSVSVNNKIYVFGGETPQYSIGSDANEIYDPVTNTWTSRNNGNPLSIPAYDGQGVTHPDVLYFPAGKDGYEYWMSYTPYPTEAEENPSIVRSHDGIIWTDAGITNPVIPLGADGTWNDQENSDPDIIFVSDIDGLGLGHDKWFMVWDGGDVATNSRKIALAWSDNGKTWTQYNGSKVNGNANPVILSGDDAAGASWERINSDPFVSKTATTTLFYEGGVFYLYYAEEASGSNRGKIGLATFTWDNPTNSVVSLNRDPGNPIIDLPADAIFKSGGGHIDIAKNAGSNTYRMYVLREQLNSTHFELGLLTSSSLTSGWTNQGMAIERGAAGQWDEDNIYRSCPVVNSSGEIVLTGNNIRMYYGGIGSQGWRIGIADIDQTTGSVVKYTGGGPQPIPSGIAFQGLMGVSYLGKIHLFYGAYHYEYDPVADTYTRKANVPNPRSWATCAIIDSHIYLIGGWDLTSGGGTNTMQILDLNDDTWDLTKTPMPVARYGTTRENPVIGGKIYVTHGWNFQGYFFTCNYVYDPVADTWELKGSANHARDGVACGVIDDKLYVVGGRNSDVAFGDPSEGIDYHEVYDPAADTWTAQPDPSGWITSGSNYAFSDATAAYPGSYQGSHGLVVRQPMDGSDLGMEGDPWPGFRSAQTANNILNTINPHVLDFDWNVTSLGGINPDFPINPQGIVRVNSNSDYLGNLLFIQDLTTPTVKWVYGNRNPLQNSEWDKWHKVNVVCDGVNSSINFDGVPHPSLSMLTYGDYNIRFGVIKTTQYVDNVRVRKWAGADPTTTVGIMEAVHGQWTGAISTDWNNAANWSDITVPVAWVNVNIPPVARQPVISSDAFCNIMTINAGASLQITGTNTLTISGNWTNNGTFTANQSSVIFNGTSPQIGTGGFYNISLPGSGTKTFTGNAVISNTLTSAVNGPVTIGTGASLTIAPSGKGTIGALTNNGTLNLNSDATGIASLILDSYTDNGTENMQLYLTGGGDPNYKWHYISSPVASLPVIDVIGSGAGSSNNLAAYYESYATPTNQHSAWFGFDGYNYQDGTSGGPTFNVLTLGHGYNYYNTGDATRTFGGALNTGEVRINLSYSDPTPNLYKIGWNLIGNPYTASINWAVLVRTPSPSIDNAIYFTKDNGFASWVNGVGVPYGTTSIIPPMQGFFVKTNENNAEIRFTPNIRIHSDQIRYKGNGETIQLKEDTETIPLIRLKIEGMNISDEAVIRFNEKATTIFDSEFDAVKFSTSGTSVSLWTYIGSVNYSINSIPFPETQTEVPVGINSLTSGVYSLTATQLQGLDNYNVYLIDKSSGNIVDLRTNPKINISVSEGLVTDRFDIKISNIPTGIENPVVLESIFNIFSSNDFVNIQTLSDEWDGKSGSVNLIDMTGRTIRNLDNAEFWKNSPIRIPTTGYSGIFIVRIQSGLMRYVRKVIIK
jgi:N-acetylneuraminic acid mutarotase